MMTKQELRLEFYKTMVQGIPQGTAIEPLDLYTGLDEFMEQYKIDPWFFCSGGDHSWFLNTAVYATKPKIIIEIGSFIGFSAVRMGQYLKKYNMNDTVIICIDPWLTLDRFLLYKRTFLGHSSTYFNFLYNVKKAGLEDVIIPYLAPSIQAYKFLNKFFTKFNLKADLIYVDGGHEYDDVYMDVGNYYHLLSDDGLMFGDDYPMEGVHTGVQAAINDLGVEDKFVQFNNILWGVAKNKNLLNSPELSNLTHELPDNIEPKILKP